MPIFIIYIFIKCQIFIRIGNQVLWNINPVFSQVESNTLDFSKESESNVEFLKKILGESLFEAGAGNIGNYDNCSFNISGTGTFRGNESSNPFIGEKGKISNETETRIEVIFEAVNESRILKNLLTNHPYEEVAFDIYPLENTYQNVGSGMTGEFEKALSETEFLNLVKKTFHLKVLKHTPLLNKPIKKVAFCGGSGSFLIKNAINSGSDAYISADIKYHEFFDAESKILIADTGHFENEQFTPEIFYELLQKKFTTFAPYLSKVITNPVNYF